MVLTKSGLFFLLCITIFYCYGGKIKNRKKWFKADPKLVQKTRELKKVAFKIMELRGHKIGELRLDVTDNEPTWGDIIMTWGLYKSLKKILAKELKRLQSGGTKKKRRGGHRELMSSKLTAPDFSIVPFWKWTQSDMPIKYTLTNVYSPSMKNEIRRALRELERQIGGCVSFQEVGGNPRGPFIDYVEYSGIKSCGMSPLGKQETMNRIMINNDCKPYGTALHETLHSLGFAHTQQRPDADQYLWINWDNIRPRYKSNFLPWAYALKNQGRFDYGSIMIYSKNSFAIDPSRDTMTPRYNRRVNGDLMGQRDGLSDEDVNIVRRIYCTGNRGRRTSSGGGGGGRRPGRGVTTRKPSGGVTTRRPSRGGIKHEKYNLRKVSNRRCATPKNDLLKCQGMRVCHTAGTFEASCNRGFYFQVLRGRYVCTNDRGDC